MNKFRETNLIVAQGKKLMQMDDLDELIDEVFGENYKKMTPKGKLNQRYNSALFYAAFNQMNIVYSPKGIIREDKTFDKQASYELEKSFVIDDEITFLLSLCRVNDLRILEKIDSNIFISDADRKELENKEGNYVVVNKRVDKIMNRYIQKKKEKQGPELG